MIAMIRALTYYGAIVVAVAAAQIWSGQGQAADEVDPATTSAAVDPPPSPDSLISREDWKRRIEDARIRAEQARREWQQHPPAPELPERIATQRVLTDDTLRPGDIVSTDKGLFLYRGKSGTDRRVTDFVAIRPR
ncbi:hypothetical protein I3J27_07610 [Bradyrhizobium xenonodulans]|uniref:Secreted protein n=1 Tax=Bradyrhizobium xenonodulans TaxID=2736875 RepID=A0ABY7MRX5_9BRAD|nr:hypothetical protein [Bradyrhizobium xenonodulans]WBL80283.1 hypothetical protein I3J27_07610 [Bradyrhizobium xenonodulans]